MSAAGAPEARALVLSTIASAAEAPQRMGSASYSYAWVGRAFAPLLKRWGSVVETVRPAPGLDDVVRRVQREHATVVHLGFLPLDFYHPAADVPNVAYPFWDFPDLPNSSLGRNPRNNWMRIAGDLDLILAPGNFVRDVFLRAGVRTPIHVVPVPVRPEYFAVPVYEPGQRVVLDCACYVVSPEKRAARMPRPISRSRAFYHEHVRGHLSQRWADRLSVAAHAIRAARREWRETGSVDGSVTGELELSGVVYTTVFNPFDQRKSWPDLLTAYLMALRDCDDATLVLKLAVPPARANFGVNKVLGFYRALDVSHRCRLVVVSDYLTDGQMLELARGSTYYLNASRAEGACLPLQDFLAAARPAIAPRHTAIADYFAGDSGFVAASTPEPTSWPQDPEGRCTTTWHRVVWESLRDAIRESYQIAKNDRPRYEALASNARARMAASAGAEPVWTRLSAALDSLAAGQGRA